MNLTHIIRKLTLLIVLLGFSLYPCAYANKYVLATGTYGYGNNALLLSKHYDNRFCKIAQSIQSRTNISLTCDSYANQQKYIRDITDNKIAMAYVSAFIAYNLMQKNPNLKSLVTVQEVNYISRKESPYYGGVIIVKNKSPFHNLMQLQNIKFGLSYHHSASGYIMPTLLFGNQLLSQNDQLLSFSQNLQEANALINGKVSAAAIWSGMLNNKILKNKVRILASYQGIPNYQLLVNTKLVNAKDEKKLLNAFLSIHHYIKHYAGFFPSSLEIKQAGLKLFNRFCHANATDCTL